MVKQKKLNYCILDFYTKEEEKKVLLLKNVHMYLHRNKYNIIIMLHTNLIFLEFHRNLINLFVGKYWDLQKNINYGKFINLTTPKKILAALKYQSIV